MKRFIVILSICIMIFCIGMTGCGGNDSIGSSEEIGTAADKGQKKAFIGGILTETNTFCPFPTDLVDYQRWGGIQQELMDAASQRGWSVVKGLLAGAAPAGKTTRSAYETMKAELLSDLKSAMPVDMVVLLLHGAMVAQGYDDCEGDLLQAVRDIVGKDIPVGASLDPHAHLSEAMVTAADILVCYKEWPHIDSLDTIVKAFNLTADCVEGKIKPHIAVWDCRMISSYFTLEEPMKGIVDDMKAAEGKDGVISVSFVHGFPEGDVPDMGSKMLVITDNQPEKGVKLAEEFGRRIYALRGKTGFKNLMELEEGLKAIAAADKFPVIVADYSDAVGGGPPGDATFILKGLLDMGIENSIIAGLWDPGAVEIALKCDVGDKLMIRIGGKTGKISGDPLDLNVEVISKSEDFKIIPEKGEEQSYGALAVVRAKGIDIILTKKRFPVYDWRLLDEMNLDPRNKRVIVVKSAQNFYAGFEPIMGSVVYVLSPGLFRRVGDKPMKRINRPKWPYDEDPFKK